MQITVFGLLIALIGIWCQFGSYRRVVIAMVGLAVFGAVSAVDLPALGGSSVTPANFFLVFYLLRLVSMRGGPSALVAEIGPRRPLFLFFLLVLWILASAVLLPRLFDNQMDVYSLTRTGDTDGDTTRLHPTTGNLSQAVYAVGGFLVACATCAFARKRGSAEAFVPAVMLVTALHLIFAVLDVVTALTHTGFILDVIHTATYAFLTDNELGGLKRLSGSFPEASVFASFSLTLLGVNFVLFLNRVRARFTGSASLMLACATLLSTSSSGYVGLAIFYTVFLGYALVTGLVFRRRRAASVALVTAAGGILLVCLVILLLPDVAKVAQTVINESLLQKSASDSALERGSWNTQAWQIFKDTHGLGAGIGTTRVSNYALVLLSNLGIIGFGLFVLLVLRVTCSRIAGDVVDERFAMVWAARIGIVSTVVPSLLIGSVYDLGTLFYGLVGIAASGVAVAVGATDRPSAATFARQPSHRPRATLA